MSKKRKPNQSRMHGIREHIAGMHTACILPFPNSSESFIILSEGFWYLNSDIYDNVVSHHNMRTILMQHFFYLYISLSLSLSHCRTASLCARHDLNAAIDFHNYHGIPICRNYIFHLNIFIFSVGFTLPSCFPSIKKKKKFWNEK